jgi:hypothetical protein
MIKTNTIGMMLMDFFGLPAKNGQGQEGKQNTEQRTRDSEPEGNAPAGLFFNIGNICVTRHGRRR